MAEELRVYSQNMEELARANGLEFFPVDYELVPSTFMMEVAVYGLPVRMPHWSFGVRYIYQFVQHQMGNSKIFEVVFPGNPGQAYLANTNSLTENTLVTAHVLGHADFSRNNLLFQRMQEGVGYHIVQKAAAHAQQIADAIERHGKARVERVLDAALALEQHIDIDQQVHRNRYDKMQAAPDVVPASGFEARFHDLPGEDQPQSPDYAYAPAALPPRPEFDLLWFIANYAPDMEDWERDIFLAVREESYYFYPVFACQIMNEGWASYWHARLLREADFLPSELYLDAIKTHSDVVRPYAGDKQISLQINPYHVGFSLWEQIIDDQGIDAAREVMQSEDDFGFIRNYLDEHMAEEMELFTYTYKPNGRTQVTERDIDQLRETILRPKYNYGAPRMCVTEVQPDSTLVLAHCHELDARGLDIDRSRKVMDYIHQVWRRPVRLHTIDRKGAETVLKVGEKAA